MSVKDAQKTADELLKETMKRLPNIEETEREQLTAQLIASLDSVGEAWERELQKLAGQVDRNRQRAIDHILSQIIPGGDSSVTDTTR